ncbi:hypothetical protein PQA73_gp59 [Erwinia phage Pavtok]|uniref:Uncharacterized protein n=1 Tax=Erwinia phage Pavtok TaxID=2267655 RepID=A0A345BM16_9CAUD|nr:hypothetical protein PQA73_gp59 [Erwinia phage Pavtok]AXF51487.1 hypothetical protein PAVTOK_59 [Erwinia phage Pavtok]
MSLTVREMYLRLAQLVNEGHGENILAVDTHQPMLVGRATHTGVTNVVAGKDWNHGACLLWTTDLLVPHATVRPEADPTGPALVERDEDGFWTHPAHPEGLDGAELNEWFAMNGLTYTTNYLLPPEGAEDTNDYAQWELRQPAGNGWYLWDIRLNQSDEPIAVWAHNL